MAELRVERGAAAGHDGPSAVSPDQRRQRDPHQESRERQGHATRGSEELAIALREAGRGPLVAHLETSADGEPLVRIVDRERGETVAVLTPDELRTLTERTGLPTGLLVQVRS